MFKRILMAFKFTPNCRTALAKAAQMAKDQNSELHVYHALNYRLATIDRQDPRIVEMVGEANKKFEEEVRPYAGDMPIHTFECAPADPGLEICKVARRIGADLI
ncbi:MAG: universal stress protein, partial [Desulfobacterales bacterium]